MKIYIITYDSAFDFETSHYIVGAYTSLKKANEIFEKEVAKLNTNGYKVEKDARSFGMWKDGYYNEDHVSIEIRASELEFEGTAYWKEVAESHLEAIQVDREGAYSNLSQEDCEDILNKSAEEFINDDETWNVIDSALHTMVSNYAEEKVGK